MSQPYFKIAGGYVYDPLNGVDGQVQDIWVQAGRVVPAPAPGIRADRTLDAAGYVVMPGGVDRGSRFATTYRSIGWAPDSIQEYVSMPPSASDESWCEKSTWTEG